MESRPSKRTGESAVRASFSIKGVKLITTTGISINEENWSDETAIEAKKENGRRKYADNYKNAKGQTVKDINAILDKIRFHFSQWDLQLEDKPTSDEIRKELKKAMSISTICAGSCTGRSGRGTPRRTPSSGIGPN